MISNDQVIYIYHDFQSCLSKFKTDNSNQIISTIKLQLFTPLYSDIFTFLITIIWPKLNSFNALSDHKD